MKLCFDSIEEVKTFVSALKGTRGKKDEADAPEIPATTAQVPAPMAIPQPPAPSFSPTAFAPPAASFSPPAPAAAGPAPEVLALVTRVANAMATRIAPGTEAAALDWFRGECSKFGLDAAQATMEQIKTNFLPKMTAPALENIAKLMGG